MQKSNNVIIAHNLCSDGLAAAWVFNKVYPDATYIFANYGDKPPDIENKDVFILDFSYPRDEIIRMQKSSRSLTVLDHHLTAKEELGDLKFCYFDSLRSGAGLAWDFLYSKKPRHWLIDMIEDKDLWRFKLKNSYEINAVINSYSLTFDSLNKLEHIEIGSVEWNNLIKEGEAILRYQRQMVSDIVKKAKEVEVCGHKVLAANTCVLQSEVANFLAINKPFGVAYYENEKGEKIYSFRSKEAGEDVSKIAKVFGGGGHKLSSGAKTTAGKSIW